MAKPTGGDWGIIALVVVGLGHNVVAAGQRREMICGAVRRHRRAHRVLVPALGAGLLLHALCEWRWDPLRLLGLATEHVAELVRRWRRPVLHPRR